MINIIPYQIHTVCVFNWKSGQLPLMASASLALSIQLGCLLQCIQLWNAQKNKWDNCRTSGNPVSNLKISSNILYIELTRIDSYYYIDTKYTDFTLFRVLVSLFYFETTNPSNTCWHWKGIGRTSQSTFITDISNFRGNPHAVKTAQ